jgi:hypothetical protein
VRFVSIDTIAYLTQYFLGANEHIPRRQFVTTNERHLKNKFDNGTIHARLPGAIETTLELRVHKHRSLVFRLPFQCSEGVMKGDLLS